MRESSTQHPNAAGATVIPRRNLFLLLLLAALQPIVTSLGTLETGLGSLESQVLKVNQALMQADSHATPEEMMSTPELIRSKGYPAEVHTVRTKDGYILELHRIPHGIRGPDSGGDQGGLVTPAEFMSFEGVLENIGLRESYNVVNEQGRKNPNIFLNTIDGRSTGDSRNVKRLRDRTSSIHANSGYNLDRGRSAPLTTPRPRPPVYLQHCLLCSSSDWVMNTPQRALAYLLADAGYDVWMGNARGNTYSRRHRVLRPSNPSFWAFSWAEMGRYDAPASIDYVLQRTNNTKLSYVGFSMGTTIFFTMMHYHPSYNQKIAGMVALAPVAYVGHLRGPLGTMMPFFAGALQAILGMLGDGEVFPSSRAMDNLVGLLCPPSHLTAKVCHNLLFALTGPDLDQLNEDYLAVILSHTPAGTSARTMLHFMQNARTNAFRAYDYGWLGNLRRYGTTTPGNYNLSAVTVPVAAFYSDNDWLATPQDTKRLFAELPNLSEVHRLRNFSHLDFVWAKDARELVYHPVIRALGRFQEPIR